MPTRKQMRAAGRELRLRREKKVQQQPAGRATRPFGSMSEENLRKYAGWPIPSEQRKAAMRELDLRLRGVEDKMYPNRAFAKADMDTVRFFANATDEEIRKRNGELDA